MYKGAITYLVFVVLAGCALGQNMDSDRDTVRLKQSEILVTEDTVYVPNSDTTVIINQKFQIQQNPYTTQTGLLQGVRSYLGNVPITREILGLLYVNKDLGYEHRTQKDQRTSDAPFKPHENKIIGRIRIKKVDLVEGSVYDTTRISTTKIIQFANKFHVDTWNSVIRNNLTIEKGERIDPFKLADNERLLRRLSFIEDAKIYIAPQSGEIVDLVIVVKDRFALGFDGVIKDIDEYNLEFYNRNIGGSGQSGSTTIFFNANNQPQYGFQISLGGQNINKLISSWRARYLSYGVRNIKEVALDKEFYSPDIKYGGGIDIKSTRDTRLSIDGESSNEGKFKLNSQDMWIGRSFTVSRTNARTNLVVSGRYLNHSFDEKPFVSRDSNFFYYDRKMILGALSIAQQKYIKANYVLGFGIAEDIPNGFRVSYVMGKDFNEFYNHDYIGGQVYKSLYIHGLGYGYTDINIGTFYRSGFEHGVFSAAFGYFSPLIDLKNYFLRNYLYFRYVEGIRQNDNRTISIESHVRDPNFSFTGNSNISFRVESVLYTPLYLLGFRFAPFLYYEFAELREDRKLPTIKKNFSSAGIGIRMKNESLVFDTFELRALRYLTNPTGGKLFFELSASSPISFEQFFRYKPRLVPFN